MEEYIYNTPRPVIYYDAEACGNAILCLKCVKACLDTGHNLIGFMNTDSPPVGETAPGRLEDIHHMIIFSGMINCNGCKNCVDACPKNALTLEMPEPRLPAPRVQRSDTVFCVTNRDGSFTIPRD